MLVCAGFFEVGFTTAMKFASKGVWMAQVLFVACVIASFTLLSEATKTIPIGIGYAVWTGIGAAGTLAVATLYFKEPISPLQIGCVLMIIAAVAGLKFSSQPA
ncbi:MAG: multidrug efflux SMR transporter [Alphaproteobacteria bacterium]|nr:multidrug efflux SMR transporter [Alphaproteobacteria bacterium]